MTRQLFCFALLAPALCLAGFSSAFAQVTTAVAKPSKPEHTFNSFQAAVQKDNVRQMVALVTDDTRAAMAFQLLVASSYLKSFTDCPSAKLTDEQKKATEDMQTVLKKHGITEKMIKQSADAPPVDPKNPEATMKVIRDIVKSIKDPTAFVVEYSSAISKFTKIGGTKWADATLKDVKVDGALATAMLVYKVGETEKSEPVSFKKVGAVWRLEFPLDALQPQPTDKPVEKPKK